jgi:hypothetical protein
LNSCSRLKKFIEMTFPDYTKHGFQGNGDIYGLGTVRADIMLSSGKLTGLKESGLGITLKQSHYGCVCIPA